WRWPGPLMEPGMDVRERSFPITLVLASAGASPLATVPADDPTLEPWVDAAGRVYGCSFREKEWCHIRIDGGGSFAFTVRSGRVHGKPEAGASRERLQDAFYRQVVPFVLQRQSWEVLHASGLVFAGAGVALCGDSQMGKSTLADAWRRRGGAVFA